MIRIGIGLVERGLCRRTLSKQFCHKGYPARGITMKFSRLFVLAAAVVLLHGLSGGVAKANTVDPRTGTGGSGSCAGPISFGSESLSQTYPGLPTTSSASTDGN